jgi:hypothetical protein
MVAGLILVSGLLLAETLAAQTVTLDEGSFRVLVKGQESGTESFSIRRNGTGESAVVIAVGRVGGGGQELNAQLQTSGPSLRPTAYEANIQGPDAQQIAGRVIGSRFSARISSAAGEMMREYLASEGAVVIDEGFAHQYWFLAQRVGNRGGRVPVIIPRLSRQITATVTSGGTDAVTVGSRSVNARRLNVSLPNQPEREVWVDSEGRVLRVEIPARAWVAVRTAVPR